MILIHFYSCLKSSKAPLCRVTQQLPPTLGQSRSSLEVPGRAPWPPPSGPPRRRRRRRGEEIILLCLVGRQEKRGQVKSDRIGAGAANRDRSHNSSDISSSSSSSSIVQFIVIQDDSKSHQPVAPLLTTIGCGK